MAAIITGTIGVSRVATVSVALSLASYVRDDHPLDSPHLSYVALEGIANLGRWLEAQLGPHVGAPVRVRLLHDGTAAALAVSPVPRAAVITLGTYLGVGFARATDDGLTPLSPGFEVRT
jgi:hypothetical protein